MPTFGMTAVKALRLGHGIPISSFCADSEISPTTLGFIEKGAAPTPSQLVQLAKGLNMDPGVLAVVLATGYLVADHGAADDVAG
jgi:hypothetical protein